MLLSLEQMKYLANFVGFFGKFGCKIPIRTFFSKYSQMLAFYGANCLKRMSIMHH